MVSEQVERVTMGLLLGKQLLLMPWSTGLFPLSHITSEPLPRKGGGGVAGPATVSKAGVHLGAI